MLKQKRRSAEAARGAARLGSHDGKQRRAGDRAVAVLADEAPRRLGLTAPLTPATSAWASEPGSVHEWLGAIADPRTSAQRHCLGPVWIATL